jgi:glycosyltransferase involved in cell wall biosynthesis
VVEAPDKIQAEFPLITIGISCFNAEKTIARAIESAMKQDWCNKEIIVVDDASTDGSAAILEEFERPHPELRIVHHAANEGYAGALNTIIQASRGDFLAFFDDDDESRQNRLTKQWRRIIDYERLHGAEMVLCYANRDVVLLGQTISAEVAMAIGREAPEPRGPMVANYLFGHLADSHHVWGVLGSCTLMARRRTFLMLDGLDASFRRFAEWDLAVRAALRGAHFIAVNERLITQYKTNSPDKSGKIPFKNALNLTRKHRDYLIKEKAYLASLAMVYARFHARAGHYWRKRLFLALAYGLLPPSTLAAKVASRFVRYHAAQTH